MTLVTALAVALSAWLSQGHLAHDGITGARLAVLPTSPLALALVVSAAATFLVLRRLGATSLPVLLLGLPLLPYLPLSVPSIFLMWSGPGVLLVWATAGWAMLASRSRAPAAVSSLSREETAAEGAQASRGRALGLAEAVRQCRAIPPALRAGILAFGIYGLTAWSVAPSVPGGDEPHYLIITQSLLLDRDLKIENNHQRGDYRAYFAGDLSKPDYYRRGRDGQIYSVHAPGVAALVAPAFAVAGYRGVVAFLLMLSAAAAALTWELARRVTGRTDAAWFGWAALVLAPTTMLNASTVYPDGPGALIALTGVWAIVRAREERTSGADSSWPWLGHGAALALLPWLHTRFALLAGCLGALVLLALARTHNPAAKASAFLTIPSLSALAWIAFFIAIYGAPDPAIPYRGSDLGSPDYILGGLGGLFFDQMYGLLVNAPVMAAAFGGVVALSLKPGAFRALPLQMMFVVVPYTLTVTHFAMWWGGFSSPARFLVPLMPAFAILSAAAWAAAGHRGTRIVLLVALLITGFMSTVLVAVDGGRMAYFLRDNVYAQWIQWANRAIDLEHALPAFFARVQRGRPGGLFFAEVGVWCAAAAAAWLLMRAVGERSWSRARGRTETAAGLAVAAAAMLATVVTWRLEGVSGHSAASASMDVLRAAGGSSTITFDLSTWQGLTVDALARRLQVRVALRSRAPGAGRDDRGLFALPQVPAGDYRLQLEPERTPGWVMVGIGRDQFAIVTREIDANPADLILRFPVDVRAIVVRADEDARARLRSLLVQPLSIVPARQKLSQEVARRAVRYAETNAFFLDEQSFPEPGGFWIGGARSSSVVLQPDLPRASVALQLRNAPVDNRVTLRSGAWREELRLAPGEERRIEVPLDRTAQAALVSFAVAGGFRPSAADPASRDTRLLGVWVTVR